MPVKGVNKVKQNMKRVFKDIREKKAVQFVNAVVSIGASQSKQWAPIEYSVLINSQEQDVFKQGTAVVGQVSFNADYAAYLEFSENWEPRPVNMKEGPAANMNATPHFLRRGFEDPESQRLIEEAKKVFKV